MTAEVNASGKEAEKLAETEGAQVTELDDATLEGAAGGRPVWVDERTRRGGSSDPV
jgi:hypothetical protein